MLLLRVRDMPSRVAFAALSSLTRALLCRWKAENKTNKGASPGSSGLANLTDDAGVTC